MKALCILIFIVLSYNFSFSVGYDNLWMMGYHCCVSPNYGVDLEFDSSGATIYLRNRRMNFSETNACITDQNGDLLFYTNGCYIANRQNDTMMNGSGLTPGLFSSSYQRYGYPIPQATLIVPFDISSSKYYLFHEEIDGNDPLVRPTNLYYSIVDMSLDNGLGAVTVKRYPIIYDTLTHGQISACRHANGRDWWIIVPVSNSNKYYKFLSTPYGISFSTQQIGLITPYGEGNGQSVFSPDGTKYSRFTTSFGLIYFDFDRCTGNFSNYRNIDRTLFSNEGCAGLSFSPNSRFLYLSYCTLLYQVDTWNVNLNNSRQLIATYDGFQSPFPTSFYTSKLGNDGKIYITCNNGVNKLHVINYPDSMAINSDVQQHAINLPNDNGSTISTQPFFNLGAEIGTPCDSLFNVISDVKILPYKVYPNPATDFIYLDGLDFSSASFEIISLLGTKYAVNNKLNNEQKVSISIADIPNGIFTLLIHMKTNIFLSRFVKLK